MKAEDARAVAETFDRILADPSYDGHHVIMSQANVTVECGTTACHAGWYELARAPAGTEIKSLFWTDGADQMARDLGFEYREDLTEWARDNPDVWGNEYGYGMFQLNLAFGDGPITLADIAEHWHGVANRLEARE